MLADNPLQSILDLIPTTLTIVNADLLDSIRWVLHRYDPKLQQPDAYIVLLLAFLAENDLIYMSDHTSVEASGRITVIRKK